jgi:tRNA 2-thiouridine synthesizing protein E
LIEIDNEGYLVNPKDWNEDVARNFAQEEGINLTLDHWKVFWFMREYYADHGIAADARFVIKFLRNDLKYGARAKEKLYELFPYGYIKQACRIAGLPEYYCQAC